MEKQQIKQPEFLAKLFAMVAKNPDGGTISPDGTIPKSGICVATKDTQNSFDLEGLQKVLSYVSDSNNPFNYVGFWTYEGKMYFDAVTLIYDREEAEKVGRENEQIGIYDLTKGEYIDLT